MIHLKNLYYSYTGTEPFLLRNISLEIKNGEYLSILGENGSGKSTLIKLILNLLHPVGGTIENQAKKTGYVPQKADDLNAGFPITVTEMLNCYRRLIKVKDRGTIRRCLETVRMQDFGSALIGTLSGGQRQKIYIARALMGNPDLLILDEPSTGVDIGSQAEIYALIKQLNTEKGITVVSVEHNLEAAVSNSTQIYHLSDGGGHLCAPDKYISEFINSNRGTKKDV
ncbi:MAG TPA: metal ABC transporter ATP-binding protein [Clostridia bacterium]|nr:metal ABC transporter ATP-binding protein [Clostridia bacterium]